MCNKSELLGNKALSIKALIEIFCRPSRQGLTLNADLAGHLITGNELLKVSPNLVQG